MDEYKMGGFETYEIFRGKINLQTLLVPIGLFAEAGAEVGLELLESLS
jgi:hypothetical protein